MWQALEREKMRREERMAGAATDAAQRAAAAKNLKEKIHHAQQMQALGHLNSGTSVTGVGDRDPEGTALAVVLKARAELKMAIEMAKDCNLPDDVTKEAQSMLDADRKRTQQEVPVDSPAADATAAAWFDARRSRREKRKNKGAQPQDGGSMV